LKKSQDKSHFWFLSLFIIAIFHGLYAQENQSKKNQIVHHFEGVPQGLYLRETFIVFGEDGKWHQANRYRFAKPHGPLVFVKDYLKLIFMSTREHYMDSHFIQ